MWHDVTIDPVVCIPIQPGHMNGDGMNQKKKQQNEINKKSTNISPTVEKKVESNENKVDCSN